jgi:F0F1-type ATP synthase membrane subunit b/b'
MLFQLIVIQVITFLAIIVVLRKLLYAETARETQRLRVLREENARKEKELADKIRSSEAAYRDKIAKADEEIRNNKANADKEIEEARNNALAKANEEAERIVNAALNAKAKMRDEVANEMQKKTPALASQLFREALSSKTRSLTHRELVQEVTAQVKKAEKSRFNVKTKTGELVSAYPLQGGEKRELLSAVSKKVGRKISLSEKEDKNLVAGVVIKLGESLVIDGSLENRLRQLEQK